MLIAFVLVMNVLAKIFAGRKRQEPRRLLARRPTHGRVNATDRGLVSDRAVWPAASVEATSPLEQRQANPAAPRVSMHVESRVEAGKPEAGNRGCFHADAAGSCKRPPVRSSGFCVRTSPADGSSAKRTVRSMRVLTVYAHPNPASFCHAVLDRFTEGLADAGHAYEVVDLYATKFDPVFRSDDYSFFAHESVPAELFDESDLRESMIAFSGGPVRRAVARRWLRDKRLPELRELVAKRAPKDVLAQQEKVAAADGLAFIAPIMWMNFPAILRGWMERVFTYGFVYTMTPEAWLQGDLGGRQPLLKHTKALIMTPTFFRESDYRESGCGAAIERLVDDFGFRYPGIEQVEHVYFYAVGAVGETTRREYLQRAYRLGHEFESGLVSAG